MSWRLASSNFVTSCCKGNWSKVLKGSSRRMIEAFVFLFPMMMMLRIVNGAVLSVIFISSPGEEMTVDCWEKISEYAKKENKMKTYVLNLRIRTRLEICE